MGKTIMGALVSLNIVIANDNDDADHFSTDPQAASQHEHDRGLTMALAARELNSAHAAFTRD